MLAENRNSASLSLISIYEISKILSSSLHLEKTMREVLNLLSSYLDMRRGLIGLLDDNGHMELIAASGLSTEAMKSGGDRFGQGVAGRILSSGMPIVIPNIADEPMAGELENADALDGEVVSLIGVPIKTTAKPFGVMTIERVWEEGRAAVNFEADVRFMTMVANLIAQTVLLHQNVAKERERLLFEKHKLQKALVEGERPVSSTVGVESVVGTSRRMQEVYGELQQIAPSRSTVLLRGESGTGKELLARAIHFMSPRKDKPFVKVNCAALPETLLESELFGHEKGSFTGATQERKGRFEQAHTGTFFLDEIGEISPSFQAKLLRVLQEGEFERVGGSKTIKVDVRLVCATNKNLEEAVSKGEFRADLYYRINVVPIFVPPLRDRREDIPLLADHFMRKFNSENSRTVRLSPEAVNILQNCYFPGNVRELENCVNRVATLTKGETVREIDLPCQRNLCLSAHLWKHSDSSKPFDFPVYPQGEPAARNGAPGNGGTSRGPAPAGHHGQGSHSHASNGHPQSNGYPQSGGFHTPDPQGGGAADHGDGGFAGGDFEFDDGEELNPTQRDRLMRAMETAGWVQAKAARLLGLTPRQIGYALKKYNIEVKRL